MIYVVLGMHKSGTTLVSRLMHHAGIRMVESVGESASYDGGGKYERTDVQDVNDAFLGSRGVESLHIVGSPPPRIPPELKATMEAIVAKHDADGGNWGFKDPRTCLTYPSWAEILPPHRLVVVYRAPGEIWPRYRPKRRRDALLEPFYAWRFVRAWCRHNRGILDALRRTTADTIVLEYGVLMTDATAFQQLADFVGRSLTDERRPELYRSRMKRHAILSLASRLHKIVHGYGPDEVLEELDALRTGREHGAPSRPASNGLAAAAPGVGTVDGER